MEASADDSGAIDLTLAASGDPEVILAPSTQQ
jgi:hypothetical protein